MSDMIEMFGAMKDFTKLKREKFGVKCPECVTKLPKANATILLPQQRCRIHKYRDPRPESVMDELYEVKKP